MSNEEIKADSELEEDELDDVETDDFSDTEDTDWKAEAQKAREEVKRFRGIAKRYKTKAEKPKEDPEPKKPSEPEKKNFDYAEKAYLRASGINPDEFSLVQEIHNETGKDIDEILVSKHFQGVLSEHREKKAAEAATPSQSKRSASSPKDTVDYWINKGELPPPDQVELRRKVVNERIKREDQGKFSSSPVVSPFEK